METKKHQNTLESVTIKNKQNGTYKDGVELEIKPFATDVTKMRKQRLMRVTLWQEN
jgi:hypothetical protein